MSSWLFTYAGGTEAAPCATRSTLWSVHQLDGLAAEKFYIRETRGGPEQLSLSETAFQMRTWWCCTKPCVFWCFTTGPVSRTQQKPPEATRGRSYATAATPARPQPRRGTEQRPRQQTAHRSHTREPTAAGRSQPVPSSGLGLLQLSALREAQQFLSKYNLCG